MVCTSLSLSTIYAVEVFDVKNFQGWLILKFFANKIFEYGHLSPLNVTFFTLLNFERARKSTKNAKSLP